MEIRHCGTRWREAPASLPAEGVPCDVFPGERATERLPYWSLSAVQFNVESTGIVWQLVGNFKKKKSMFCLYIVATMTHYISHTSFSNPPHQNNAAGLIPVARRKALNS